MESYKFILQEVESYVKDGKSSWKNKGSVEEVGGKVQVITSKVLQGKNGIYTDSRGKKILYDIDKAKIKLLYPVLQEMIKRHVWRKHKRNKITSGLRGILCNETHQTLDLFN